MRGEDRKGLSMQAQTDRGEDVVECRSGVGREVRSGRVTECGGRRLRHIETSQL